MGSVVCACVDENRSADVGSYACLDSDCGYRRSDSPTCRRRSSTMTGVPVWTLCLTLSLALPAPLVDPAFTPFL